MEKRLHGGVLPHLSPKKIKKGKSLFFSKSILKPKSAALDTMAEVRMLPSIKISIAT